jgi:transcriptional regulator with XRE-family HTH domain
MNHDRSQPKRAATTAPDPDQRSSQGDSVRPFPYWIITFDGTRLRRQRRECGLSQERLSHRSGVSVGTIQRVEKLPAADCHVGTLQRLASALSPEPDALISELTENASDPAHARTPRMPVPRQRADHWWQQAKPFPARRTDHRRYTADMARELLAKTSEFPNTKGGMLILLTEYRHALYDVASEPGIKPAPSHRPKLADTTLA